MAVFSTLDHCGFQHAVGSDWGSKEVGGSTFLELADGKGELANAEGLPRAVAFLSCLEFVFEPLFHGNRLVNS